MEKYHRSPVRDYAAVANYAGTDNFDVVQPDMNEIHKDFTFIEHKLPVPSDMEINEVLKKMGKTKPSDHLNCGSCGYNTCREKAIAICQGKAEYSMCLPFLKDRAEGFSDTIVKNTPNGLIVLNEDLEVQQINDAARSIMIIRNASDVLGDQVIRILDPTDFVNVLTMGKNIRNKRMYLAEYNRYVEQTIVHEKNLHLLIGILRDVQPSDG